MADVEWSPSNSSYIGHDPDDKLIKRTPSADMLVKLKRSLAYDPESSVAPVQACCANEGIRNDFSPDGNTGVARCINLLQNKIELQQVFARCDWAMHGSQPRIGGHRSANRIFYRPLYHA